MITFKEFFDIAKSSGISKTPERRYRKDNGLTRPVLHGKRTVAAKYTISGDDIPKIKLLQLKSGPASDTLTRDELDAIRLKYNLKLLPSIPTKQVPITPNSKIKVIVSSDGLRGRIIKSV